MKKLGFVTTILAAALLAPGMFAAKPATSTASGPAIALLDSSVNTFNFFGANFGLCDGGNFLGANEYQRYFLGWKFVLDGQRYLSEATYPNGDSSSPYNYQIVHDTDVTNGNLNNFAILILSNDASLTPDEQKAIQQWVLKGGNLIATYGSGYAGIILNPSQFQNYKPESGGTFGLHDLWHDPMTQAYGTNLLDPSPYVDVTITNAIGPAAITDSSPLWYGAQANILQQRPAGFNDMLAVLDLIPDNVKGIQPAILLDKASKGQVVYYSFAPEFIVSLAYDLAGHCAGDANYPTGSPAYNQANGLGPNSSQVFNGFCGFDTVNGSTYSACSRPAPLIDLMKRTIDYMVTGQ